MFESKIKSLDNFQRKSRTLGYLLAVYRKASDDKISSLAALFAYYALFSIFPLLLILVSVLGVVLSSDLSLRDRIVNSALANLPIIGSQLRSHVGGLKGSSLGLGIGTITLLLASRSLASLAIRALNDIWNVPNVKRVGLPLSLVRQLLWTTTVGCGVTLSTFFAGFGSMPIALGVLVSAVINVATFLLAARIALGPSVTIRSFWGGATLGALLWEVLQAFGGALVKHDLSHASSTYGFFAIVIGLLTWMYTQAYLTLLAAEIDVVREKSLWPRSLVQDDPTDGDKRSESLRMQQISTEK